MTIDEVKRLLRKMSTYDGRKAASDDEQVMSWHDIMAGIAYQEAADAVSAHYSRTREWLMPKDLLDIVKRRRTEVEADEARTRGYGRGTQWRHCGTDGCLCTHTSCYGGVLDQLEEYKLPESHPFAGQTYRRTARCPQCAKAKGLL